MIKLQTPVADTECMVPVTYEDRIMMLGSCFTDNVGQKLADWGFNVCINPFGTLYNPASIAESVARLANGRHFTEDECVWMGSGAGKVCSFSHHTSYARPTVEEFLENANRKLDEACVFFRDCSKVIITLGTAWCFRYTGGPYIPGTGLPEGKAVRSEEPLPSEKYRDRIVSNCLKRDAKEFSRERLTVGACTELLNSIIDICSADTHADTVDAVMTTGADRREREIIPKQIIFTVSPIRHMADGAHGNQLSKSTLLLGIENILNPGNPAGIHGNTCRSQPGSTAETGCHIRCDYFPAYEIMMDELRDYRFYAEDMVHPSQQAVDYIAERFLDRALPEADKPLLEEKRRQFRRSRHIPKQFPPKSPLTAGG